MFHLNILNLYFLINYLTFWSISPNFKELVFTTAIKYGDDEDWLKLFDRFSNTSDNNEKLTMLHGLASTQNYQFLK